ncbi:MAG: SLC13 family permease, partial [Burkholderiales bacterium]
MELSLHAIAVMALTVLAFALFASDKLAIETISFGVLVALTAGFQLFPHPAVLATDLFFGFGHEALVAICGLMILGRGLAVTGALEPAARLLARLLAVQPGLAMLGVLVLCAAASSVVNDTPIVVLMLPVLVGAALRAKTSPAKTLLPMNYAVLIGGMGTTIGTSTNLIVVAIAADLGVQRFHMFDFIHVTALAAVGGILYLWLVLPRLIPERASPIGDAAPQVFSAVLHIAEGGFADGKALAEVQKKAGVALRITRILRGEGLELARLPTLVLRASDRLHVRAGAKDLQEFAELLGAKLFKPDDPVHPVDE